jgi:hypothetical protein
MNTWHAIAKISPDALMEGRVQLHYAIQFIAATGTALAEPLPDYSHTSLVWNSDLEVFVGSSISAAQSFQVALEPVSLTLILLDKQSETIASFPLDKKTMAEGLNWLKQEISKLGVDASKIAFLDYPANDFPDHALAHGASFDTSQELVLSELVNYYANTEQQLQKIIATMEDATSPCIWSHHFDLATLIMLPGTKDGNPLTIGIGLSPGDPSYQEPYWYVSPYPHPDTASLPVLDGHGFWHTQHWVGAVLLASRLPETVRADAQQQQVEAFLNSALRASILLLESGSPVES